VQVLQTTACNPHCGTLSSNTKRFSFHDVTSQFLLALCTIYTATCARFLGSKTCCTGARRSVDNGPPNLLSSYSDKHGHIVCCCFILLRFGTLVCIVPFLLTVETRDMDFVHSHSHFGLCRTTLIRLVSNLSTVAACALHLRGHT
jgi:hypothetical protein